MTVEQREEFWRRFLADVEVFRASLPECDVMVNPFEVRRWYVKFSKRRLRGPAAFAELLIAEHVASTNDLLLAAPLNGTVEDVEQRGQRLMIPVFYDAKADRFSLQADHGPVAEAQMPAFFSRLLDVFLERL